MNYLLSLGVTRVAYALTLALIFEIVGITLFHEDMNQIVDVVLIASILSVIVQMPFLMKVRGEL